MASQASGQVTSGAKSRRRTSSAATKPTSSQRLQESHSPGDRLGASSGFPTGDYAQPLATIPGTPYGNMSLSRSPSPRHGGGWSSPGLTSPCDNVSGKSSPRKPYNDVQMNGSAGGDGVTWESARARTEEVKGYPSFSTQNNGFFSRHARKLSTSLPTFSMGGRRNYSDKEKLGRGRWRPFLNRLGRSMWRLRLRLAVVFGFVLAIVFFYITRE